LQFYFGQTKYTSQPDLEFSCEGEFVTLRTRGTDIIGF
jgi:hypothetical protein